MRVENVLACVFQPQEDPGEVKLLFVLADEQVSGWLTSKTLLALVSILAERLRHREARRLAQVAEELIHLELPLDASLVQKASLTHHDLVVLKANIDMATFIHHNLVAALRKLSKLPTIADCVERVESRVKSPKSIVQKVIVRKSLSIEQLNDFVGVRLIVSSIAAQQRICELIENELNSSTSDLSRTVPTQTGSLQIEEVCSVDGYKATHLRFLAVAPSKTLTAVSCEIQVRTIFQDTWARLSQMLAYKKSGQARNRELALMSQLAELRDDCDRTISDSNIRI
jgi:ppGpp synthetase/RelA/SpoT-type nucleotidyltranferase